MTEIGSARRSIGWGASLADHLVIVALALLLFAPSIATKAPTGHDAPHHLIWIENFSAQFAADEPYPRWLAGLWYGAGGADLFFYSPLIGWMASLLNATACPDCTANELSVALGVMLQAVSGAGLRVLGLQFVARWAALAGALVYMALPYHLATDWYVRSALSEFAATAILPWHLAAFLGCLWGRSGGVRLALLSALLVLCHLPTCVILASGEVVLLIVAGRGRSLRVIGPLMAAGVVGLGIAAIYWVPALSLLDSVRGDILGGAQNALANLPLPANLGRDPFVDSLWLPFALFTASTVPALAGAARGPEGVATTVVALVAFAWVMISPISIPLWWLTPVSWVQFPWRYFVLADVGFALAAAAAAEAVIWLGIRTIRGAVSSAGFVAIVTMLVAFHPGIFQAPGMKFRTIEEVPEGAGGIEWLPSETRQTKPFETYNDYHRFLAFARDEAEGPVVRLDSPGSAVTISTEPRRLEFEVDLPVAASVVIHRTFWRFWSLRNAATGREIQLNVTPGFPMIQAQLPAGRARYVLELPMLPEERLGAWISATSLILLLAWAGLTRFRRGS